jgi:hypothetical protein
MLRTIGRRPPELALCGSDGDGKPARAVLYDGEARVPFGDRLWAVPVRTLWEDA